MSATLARLRKRAAEFEQKKQFDRALEVYVQILDEGGKDLGDEDVPLFNRVGDMLMRKGSVTEALGYYERAVDMYAERGYLNNAIALCSKILRQSPGRAAVYYKLARISARKGFKSDARKNFLEYADRMQKLGMADEAFRALKEFASLYPDQDDVRLVLAELLSKENRKGEALEQLQSLYEKLQSEGRAAEARATIDRMRAIDPSVTPREGSVPQSAAAGDLVFLDLTDSEPRPPTPRGAAPAQPPSARAPMPTPVPALTGLSITFFPDAADAPHPDGFEATAVEPEPAEPAQPVDIPAAPEPAAIEVTPAFEPSPETLDLRPDEPEDLPDDGRAEVGAETPNSPDSDLEALIEPEAELAVLDLSASREADDVVLDDVVEDTVVEAPDESSTGRPRTPLSGIEFADLELEEPDRDPRTRQHDLALPGVLPPPPRAPTPGYSLASTAASDDARAAAEEAADLAADIAAREIAMRGSVAPAPVDPLPFDVDEVEPGPVADPDRGSASRAAEPAEDSAVPDDFLSVPPRFGPSSAPGEEHAFPPLFGMAETPESPSPAVEDVDAADGEVVLDLPGDVLGEALPEPAGALPEGTSHATVTIGSAESHLRSRLELEPENWSLRRQLGEALLDTGDRDGGLFELELAAAGYEGAGDLERANEVVDEILSVVPTSIIHHQKRVEFAVKSRDRGRLTRAYLELADALFRTGAGDKAVAVYSRVLELAPGDERAEFALATLAPDALVRLRGLPARPERWTDELQTIDRQPHAATRVEADLEPVPSASDAEVARGPAGEATPDESPTTGTPAAVPAQAPPRVHELELPHPDWGEGVPQRHGDSRGDLLDVTLDHSPTTDRPDLSVDHVHDEPPTVTPEAAEPPAVDVPVSTASSASDFDGFDAERLDDGPAEEPPVFEPGESMATEEPAQDEDTSVPQAWFREPTPVSVPRAVTPSFADRAIEPRVSPARPLTPATGNESDLLDLGEWLRETEPQRSTRMQVEDPKPTGDEQADFEELLRRFKRGVAENVEAEDYEAHYDLGVAYKEMGLTDEAIAQFQKALRGPANRVRTYEALGQCFVEKEQHPIAAALLQRATEVPGADDQQLVGVLYLLGYAMEQMGRPADALPYYLRVFAVDIEFRDIAERVAAMGNLTK